jgi:23S rRNA (cytosine1962-C5)-methyltransferase
MTTARVVLKARRARPFFGRHPWVYAGAIEAVEGDPRDGDVVDLFTHDAEFVARGLFNSRSKIRVRLYTWSPAQALDADFFRGQLETAIHLRRDILHLMGPGQACRLVFSEADGISGLTVDRFDRWLVVQFTSLALALRRDLFGDLLTELLHPEGIYVRTERGIGQLEGLELQDGPFHGLAPTAPLEIEEHGLRLLVNLTEGQKTGYYLDQRDNRQVVARLAVGRRMLDAFCYSGGFGLHAARAGATVVVGIDASEAALQLARANAQLNGLANVTFEKADVFHRLNEFVMAQDRFGVVVLDPPKFARSGSAVEEALRGYRRLLAQALKILEPNGILAMCCCSGLITRDMLHELLALEATRSARPLQILESRAAAPDHPVSALCPETNYLKCVICRVV